MGLTINIQTGGLGKQSADTDGWGGLYVGVVALPAGWAENEVVKIFKPEDLLSYGIKADAATPSLQLVYWHVSEVFRLAPNSTLYVQLGTIAALHTYTEILTAFKNASNVLRLFSVVMPTTELVASEANGLHDALESLFDDSVQPARAILTCLAENTNAIPDFAALDYYRVQVDIANDITVGGLAKTIFDSALGMCGAGGTFLGMLLNISVHVQQSWNSLPVNGDGRWSLLGDINGDSVETKTESEKAAYSTAGVVLITRTLRAVDAYFLSARTAGAVGDDYDVLNNGRVIDKAITLTYDALQPFLNGPVYTDPTTGKLSAETITLFQNAAYSAINTNMVLGRVGDKVELVTDQNTGSLSTDSVYINPNVNVSATGTIIIQLRLRPVGAANDIIINIGLTA